MADSPEHLVQFLTNLRVPKDVIAYMTVQMKMGAVADFASYFDDATFSAGVDDDVVAKVASHANDKLVVGRLRTLSIKY